MMNMDSVNKLPLRLYITWMPEQLGCQLVSSVKI